MHLHVQILQTNLHGVSALKVESTTTQQVSYLSTAELGVYCILQFLGTMQLDMLQNRMCK